MGNGRFANPSEGPKPLLWLSPVEGNGNENENQSNVKTQTIQK